MRVRPQYLWLALKAVLGLTAFRTWRGRMEAARTLLRHIGKDTEGIEVSPEVERVAHALRIECRRIFGSYWSNANSWRLARAAIEAMRGP